MRRECCTKKKNIENQLDALFWWKNSSQRKKVVLRWTASPENVCDISFNYLFVNLNENYIYDFIFFVNNH